AVAKIMSYGVREILYVSCNPKTLAMNVRQFSLGGYKPVYGKLYDNFLMTRHVETVVLLCRKDIDSHIEVKLELDEDDVTKAESKGTYENIKEYVLDNYGFKVSTLYIAQIKRKCGLELGENYNKSKKENSKVPECPKEKEDAIMDALRYFGMIVQEG
ncbi:MAG: 23S rRNA (uracil-5-)-methyltransferase RumA, partial [Faecalicoccus sp.]|nr:23S rRNA (uracil-5-)-methyltransferase RumA [Faecalicoccus sp.]